MPDCGGKVLVGKPTKTKFCPHLGQAYLFNLNSMTKNFCLLPQNLGG